MKAIFTYKIVEEQYTIGHENYTVYGIEIHRNGSKIKDIHDVFTERILAERTADLLSKEQPDMVHFDIVLESILQDPEYMLGINYGQAK